jgi:hypothetical protein
MTRRLATCATMAVLGNSALVVWHLHVLGGLHPALTGARLALFGVAVNLVPFIAMAMFWAGRCRLAGWLLGCAFGLALAVGGYVHFLGAGPDNVFDMAAGPWTQQFRISATLLVIVQVLACWVGVRAANSMARVSSAGRRRA